MPRLSPPEALAVEVMAKLVAEGAQKRTVRGDLFLDGGPHPETDEQGFGMVVPEQPNSRTAFADSKRAGSKYADPGLPNQVETRCNRQKLRTCLANGRGRAACMAEAIDFANACNCSSSGTSNAVSRSLSRNLARNAAVLGGRRSEEHTSEL